jgi:DNA-binding SARP family transcriptional activator
MSLRLELLGGFRAIAGQKPAGQDLTARHHQIIAFLALQHAPVVARQKIAGLLWPDSTDAQALTNLRRELHHLRQVLPEIETALDIGTRTLGWRASRVVLDLDEFRHAAEEGLRGRRDRLEAAAALYIGDLLPECDDGWIVSERSRVRDQAIQVIAALIKMLDDERAFGPAIDQAQRLLQIDPLHEGAWRSLMRSHARRGERAVALQVYQRCVAVLKQAVGAPPDPATHLVYREILESDERTAPARLAPPPKPLTYPLLGRRDEFVTLGHAWQSADGGRPQVVLVRGEAGIGKTRLAEELLAWAAGAGIRSASTRCYAGEGRLPYAPITAWLQSAAVQPALDALDPGRLAEVARIYPDLLSSRPDVAPPASQLETWQRPRFFEALARVFYASAPLVLVLDDLQWCDSESLEWLHFLFRSHPSFRGLLVGTVRAEEAGDNAALGVFARALARDERLTTIDLGPLDEAATVRLAEEAAGRTLDDDARTRMFGETEGHPLHIVERTRMTVASGTSLPPRVQAVVVARLVQLPPEAREVAELAAVIGRDFAFDVLAHASDLEEQDLVRAVDELWRRHIVRAQDAGRWDFSHDRIREVAYANVGPARQRLLHRRVAQALQHLAGSDPDRVAASIATHYERAGLHARAIEWFERAAQVAARVSAHEEAIRCLTLALDFLRYVPAGADRDRQELALRAALSRSLTPARGYAAAGTEENLERIASLEAADRGSIPVRWLWGLWTMRFVMGDLKTARRLAEQALAYAETDESCRCEAHHALAGTLANFGELDAARRHFEIAIDAYDEGHPQYSALGSELGVFIHAWYSHVLCLLDFPDQARTHAEKAIAHATRLDHPYSLTVAHAYAALTHQLRRDVTAVRSCAEALTSLCERHGFTYYSEWALIFLGWVACHEGRYADGLALIETGLARLDAQRAQARRPYYLSLLAESYAAAGQPARALEHLDRALSIADTQGDAWWLAELLRMKSELLPSSEAEELLRQAVDIARRQHSRALERRAEAVIERRMPRTVARTLYERPPA